jgi:hypothetical protein
MHKPLFASNHDSSNGQDFWNLLYDAGADVVLSGHYHAYERFAKQDPNGVADLQGIREFIVGTGGSSLSSINQPAANSEVVDVDTHGILKLTLNPTSYDWEFIPVAGQSFTDSGSDSCVTLTTDNEPPVATDDTASTSEDTAAIVDVAANDSDPDGNLDPTTANSSCTNGSAGCLGASNGSLTDNGDGTITYTPDPDFNGSDSFVYEICDTIGSCDTATVSITVTPVNDPPVANPDSASTSEDTPVTIDATANDTDVDGNLDPTTTSVTSGPTSGSVANNGDGTFDYTPKQGFGGSDSLELEL